MGKMKKNIPSQNNYKDKYSSLTDLQNILFYGVKQNNAQQDGVYSIFFTDDLLPLRGCYNNLLKTLHYDKTYLIH